MQECATLSSRGRLLHVIVGHKFPNYFENAAKSVAQMTENDDILIVENASNEPEIVRRLKAIARAKTGVSLMLRTTNDISKNSKVGGLYDAYNEVMAYALEQDYDYVHIMQHDMQMLWWDESVVRRARQIFSEFPQCVNIQTMIPYQLMRVSENIEILKPKLMFLPRYGLTDTGLYDMAKWRNLSMRFSDREQDHAAKYLREGLQVICHPLPTVAPIPWPAVVRNGKIIGREVKPRHEFLLKPLSSDEINQIKESSDTVWSEDVCHPWGWTCLTPYWVSDLRSIHYLVYLRRAIRVNGLRAAWPRWEHRVKRQEASAHRRGGQRQPRFGMTAVIMVPLWHLLRRRNR